MPVFHWRTAGVVLCVALTLVAPGRIGAQTLETSYAPRDVMLLVDVSSSMDDIFPQVQSALLKFADDLRPHDTLSLIAFSDQVEVARPLAASSQESRNLLRDTMSRLQPKGRFTNITGALYRGIQELEDTASTAQANERVAFVILVTDGRHNPPPGSGAPTFQKVLDNSKSFEPGEEWFIHYITVRDVVDDATIAFVTGIGGQISKLNESRLDELSDVLDTLELPVVSRVVAVDGAVRISHKDAPPADIAVDEALNPGDMVLTQPAGRCVIAINEGLRFGIDAGTLAALERAAYNPITRTYNIQWDLPLGSLWGSVEPPAGRRAHVSIESPRTHTEIVGTAFQQVVDKASGTTSLLVATGEVALADSAGARKILVGRKQLVTQDETGAFNPISRVPELWERTQALWQEALVEERPLHDVAVLLALLRWEALAIDFGTVEPGQRYEKRLSIALPELADHSLGIALDSETLPPEFAFTTALQGKPGNASLVIALDVPENWEATTTDTIETRVRLTGVPRLGESVGGFPLALTIKAPVSAGETGGVATLTWLILFGTVVTMGAASGVAVWNRNRGVKLPLGRLYLLDNPMPQQWREHVIDLEIQCTRKKTERLTFGAAVTDHIRLPGDSVIPHHATFEAKGWGRANRRVQVTFPPASEIWIDGNMVYTGPITLQDKMTIQLGDYLFEYEDSSRYEQVEIALSKGMIARGTLRSWDMEEESFYVALQDQQLQKSTTAEVVVLWSEVDSVAVMRKSKKRTRAEREMRGYPAQVIMQSGRKYQGLLRKDYSKKQKRFFFFPEQRLNVDYMVIEAGNVEKVRVRWGKGGGSGSGDTDPERSQDRNE